MDFLEDLARAIYWNRFTPEEQLNLLRIVNIGWNDKDCTDMSIATKICDYLEIPRRSNRICIISVLNKHLELAKLTIE